MCICTYPLPHFWHHNMWTPQNLYLQCEDISKVLLLFQCPMNLSITMRTMVAAFTVSSHLDSLWLLTCLRVSLFQGMMLPPNHILSILLWHQFTIKKVYRLHSCNIKALYYTKLIPAELFGSCAVSSILAHQSTQLFHKSSSTHFVPISPVRPSVVLGSCSRCNVGMSCLTLDIGSVENCRKSQAQVCRKVFGFLNSGRYH